jgi:hypothetical protein
MSGIIGRIARSLAPDAGVDAEGGPFAFGPAGRGERACRLKRSRPVVVGAAAGASKQASQEVAVRIETVELEALGRDLERIRLLKQE